MRILIFGRGVISTQYAWALEKAGNEVIFYVRPGKMQQYKPYVNLDILDGRKHRKGLQIIEKWQVKMIEEINPEHNYDLILISVNHNQLEEAAKIVGSNTGNATVLIFNNIWANLRSIATYFPKRQLLWGFPGGGGGYSNKQSLKGGIMKTVFLESEPVSVKDRYRKVLSMFQNAGFSVMQQKDMQSWLWDHFLMNVAMSVQVMKVGSHQKLYHSKTDLKDMILLIKEMTPLIYKKGGTPGFLTRILTKIPIGMAAWLLQKATSDESLAGNIMLRMEESGHATDDMNSQYIKEIIDDAHKFGLKSEIMDMLQLYTLPTEARHESMYTSL